MASGMIGWIENHPDLALAGGAVGILLIAGSFFKGKTPTAAGATQDLSGLTNGIVYVPTQTSFTTNNRTQSGVFASNDPLLTSVTTGPVNSPTTTKTTNPPPVVVVPPVIVPPSTPGACRAGYHFQAQRMGVAVIAGSYPVQGGYCIPDNTGPIKSPPPPGPNPPPTTKSLKWTSTHTVQGGDTLTSLAAAQNRYNQGRNGMPEQYNITWSDLWQHNQGVVTKYANMHGHYDHVWDWVFPGETLVVPIWV